MMYYVCNFTVHICLWNTPDSFAATNPSAAFSDPSKIVFDALSSTQKFSPLGFLALQTNFLASPLPTMKRPTNTLGGKPNGKTGTFEALPNSSSRLPWGSSCSPGRLPSRSNTSPLASVMFGWYRKNKKPRPRPCACVRGTCFGDEIRFLPSDVGISFHKAWNKNR